MGVWIRAPPCCHHLCLPFWFSWETWSDYDFHYHSTLLSFPSFRTFPSRRFRNAFLALFGGNDFFFPQTPMEVTCGFSLSSLFVSVFSFTAAPPLGLLLCRLSVISPFGFLKSITMKVFSLGSLVSPLSYFFFSFNVYSISPLQFEAPPRRSS